MQVLTTACNSILACKGSNIQAIGSSTTETSTKLPDPSIFYGDKTIYEKGLAYIFCRCPSSHDVRGTNMAQDGKAVKASVMQPMKMVQNKCLRRITGGYKRTPMAALEREADIQLPDLYMEFGNHCSPKC
jgi:hypothetical protein